MSLKRFSAKTKVHPSLSAAFSLLEKYRRWLLNLFFSKVANKSYKPSNKHILQSNSSAWLCKIISRLDLNSVSFDTQIGRKTFFISQLINHFLLSLKKVFFFAGGNSTLEDTNITKPFCSNVNLSESQMLVYRYSLVLVQYIIPVFVISFVYIQVSFFACLLMNSMLIFYVTIIQNRWL